MNDVPAPPPVVTAAVTNGANVHAASPPVPIEQESHNADEPMSPPPAPMRFVPMYMPAATKEDVAKKIVEMIGTAGASDTALAELMI